MRSTDRAAAVFRRVLSPGGPTNQLLRIGLGVLAVAGSLAALGDLVSNFPRGVDLNIPLQAATRWLAGGRAYVPEAFANRAGFDLPFLYPPYALPLFAPFTAIAFPLLQAIWFAVSLTIAVAVCRRLGVPRWWIPLMLVWPPFAEGLIAGNVQIAIFAAFVFLFEGPGASQSDPTPRRSRPILRRGLLSAATAFLKVSQPHVIVYQLRWDRRASFVAMFAIVALVAATLPLTGTSIWLDWIDQLRRAADPDWVTGGPSLSRLLPAPLGTIVIFACLAAVVAVPKPRPAAWVGVLLVLGAPTLHTYYLLFLLPAMLRIRREIAFVAALLITTYTEPAWWIAITVVTGTLALSRNYPGLLEPPNETLPSPAALTG